MGSSTNLPPPSPSAAFLDRFATLAGSDGVLRFDEFMRLALYDPKLGYYRQSRSRVGYAPGTDFFTASTSGAVFGELIAAAARSLLGDERVSDYTFVEIGAEHPGGILAGCTHPFHQVRTFPLGSPLEISGPCVVFSNELFDAQPCRRFIGKDAVWREQGVICRNGTLAELELPLEPPPAFLPAVAPSGYRIDAPTGAVALLDEIAAQSWHGLFIACDYGKSWEEMVTATPQGTARAYSRHTQSNDLLSRPGDQDLTCHVCWDWLADSLRRHNFCTPAVESQEAFFIHYAGSLIAQISAEEATRMSTRKLSLMQLLHPAHLGQKFQVLHARRLASAKDS